MSNMLVTLTVEQLHDVVREAVRMELSRMTQSSAKEVLNLSEAADFLGRHPKVVMKMVKEGSPPIPAHFISEREPRFKRSELLTWLDALPKQAKET